MSLQLKANTMASGVADPTYVQDARIMAVNLLRASEATVTASIDETGGEKENAYAEGFTFDFWRTVAGGTDWLRASFTAGYVTGEFLDTTRQTSDTRCCSISSNGLHIYVGDASDGMIYSYALSTPFDLSTGVFGGELDVSGQTNTPGGIAINIDGSHLYVLNQGAEFLSYTLSVPYDLSTATYNSGEDLDVSGQESSFIGIAVSSNGLHIFGVGVANDKVYAYTLSTAWDLSSATYDSNDLDIAGETTDSTDMALSEDGLAVYVVSFAGLVVYIYDLTIPYDLSTAAYRGSGSDVVVGGEINNPRGVTVSPDQSKLFVINVGPDNGGNGTIYAYTIGVSANALGIAAHDLHNHGGTVQAQYAKPRMMFAGDQDALPLGIALSSDGLHVYIVGAITVKIYSYTLSVAYDLASAVYDGASFDLSVSGQDATPHDLAVSNDGLNLCMIGQTTDRVYFYTMSTAFNLSTATYDGAPDNLSVSGQDGSPTGVTVSSDGLHLYVSGGVNAKIYAYTFGSSWDGSTLTYDGAPDDLSVSGQDAQPEGLTIRSDGKKIYMVGFGTDKIYSYSMSVAYDLSTAVYDSGHDLDVSPHSTKLRGVSVSSDGSQLFLLPSSGFIRGFFLPGDSVATTTLLSAEHFTWLNAHSVFTPKTSEPILILFDDVTALHHRLLITTTSEPNIGAVCLGSALKMDGVLDRGHTPPHLNRINRSLPLVADGGQFLGRSTVAEGALLRLLFDAVSLDWLRSHWESHVRLLDNYPFFFAARDVPKIDGIAEGEVFYGWPVTQPRAQYISGVYAQIEMEARGIVT